MSQPKSYTKTRIVAALGYSGKWVIQGWWPATQVWADIGEPHDTMSAAQARLREIELEDD